MLELISYRIKEGAQELLRTLSEAREDGVRGAELLKAEDVRTTSAQFF